MNTHPSKKQSLSFVFFGTPEFATEVLDELKRQGFIPALIITAPDKPQGRKLLLTPPPAKIWGEKNNIPILQPEKLDSQFIRNLESTSYSLFVVAAYGKIIPKSILALPRHGALNVHPSLLPMFRGASPIQSAILAANKTGTTIMLMDEELDHGPIIAQEILDEPLPIRRAALEEKLAHLGGQLLAKIIPQHIEGATKPQEQNHAAATYTKKIKKEDGFFDLKEMKENPEMLFRKFCAYDGWPTVYFFIKKDDKNLRVIVKEAALEEGVFVIKKVLPEGKTVMDWDTFQRMLI
ncbi:MAG: methionyl-tRNA formyltransferase [Candidatus Lloydbacteria bacterium]|nr:methionyl-tRNA formyltransferase [Candidatus Lloydbacteria bacterium]